MREYLGELHCSQETARQYVQGYRRMSLEGSAQVLPRCEPFTGESGAGHDFRRDFWLTLDRAFVTERCLAFDRRIIPGQGPGGTRRRAKHPNQAVCDVEIDMAQSRYPCTSLTSNPTCLQQPQSGCSIEPGKFSDDRTLRTN